MKALTSELTFMSAATTLTTLLLLPGCGFGLDSSLSTLKASTVPSSAFTLKSDFSFTPTNGAIGTLITASGRDFSHALTFNVGSAQGLILSQSTTSLVAMVMPSSSSGYPLFVDSSTNLYTAGTSFTVTATGVPANQQGSLLIGTGVGGTSAYQGCSAAISSGGNTALIGGYDDNSIQGAVWIFSRSGTTWTQQGSKLAGTGGSAGARQGSSVALSADGNTALVGGPLNSGNIGAAWIFTRSGGTWTQQGSKLVSSDGVNAIFGLSTALSADGNTALIGGSNDNGYVGAAWIFTRSGGTWTQQGSKLIGTGATGLGGQGSAVTLSADGNTALIAAQDDNGGVGATWVFTRSGGTWTQQGSKLVGSGYSGASQQGYHYCGNSIALSANGNTALIGGHNDNGGEGAVWIFIRTGTTWTQQGSKLVGTGAISGGEQGISVSLSADGNTALVGGSHDNTNVGATWVFTRSGTTWTQHGSKLMSTGGTGAGAEGGAVSLSADGSTALIGRPFDNTNIGAAAIFTP